MAFADQSRIQTFIAHWQNSGAAERANYQLFLSEFYDLLDRPTARANEAGRRGDASLGQVRSLPNAKYVAV